MITSRDLTIDVTATLGNEFILVRCSPQYLYVNNIATQERKGTKYLIALPQREMKRIVVSVPGPQALNLDDCSIMDVEFDGLEIFVYLLNGKLSVGARAERIRKRG